MELIDKVLTILNSLESISTVIYDNTFGANLRIDRQPAPYAILYLLKDWNIDISKGTSKESANIQLFFATPTMLDVKAEDKVDDIDNMAQIAKEFLYLLLQDNTIIVEDDSVVMRSTYGQYDKMVVGVSLELRITEKQGSCMWVPEP